MQQYEDFVALSRYSRFRDELGRRETWPESVARLINYWTEKHPNHEKWFRETAYPAIVNKEVMPSMRSLMTAGKALDRDHVAGYNCSYTPIDDPRCFDEIMYILLCGTGVGFSVERQYVQKLPEVPEEFHDTDTVIKVPDSKVGWASSFRELISLLYAGKIPQWDMSRIRPAGARLKTFGGRASGPQPLIDLFEFTVELFKNAAGRQLSSLECHDLACKIGDVVVVGGVRRSALISLSNLSDDRMRMAKSGQWWVDNPQRALANNSACYTEKPEFQIFLDEWKSLYESKSGERGVFNRKAARKKIERIGRRDTNYDFGTNPCVTGDTEILTSAGYYPIKKLVGSPVDIWNGVEWSLVKPFSTGVNPIVRVNLSDGASLECTPYHKFILAGGTRVCADELQPGDRFEKFDMPEIKGGYEYNPDPYSQGFYSGDGNEGLTHSWVYDTKYSCIDRLEGDVVDGSVEGRRVWKHGKMFSKSFVPVNGSLSYKLDWLAGLIDSDGTVTRDANGNGIQIASVNRKFLLDVRKMLTTMGVKAKVVGGAEEGYRQMPDGKGGSKEYWCKETSRLLIGNTDTYRMKLLGLETERAKIEEAKPQRDARRFVTVVSVEDTGREEETFCFTDKKNNSGTFEGIVTGNCSEILLRPRGLCNLTEAIVRPEDDLNELKRKVEIATILGTFQSTLTDFRYLRKEWKRNAEEERLLGVSLTGIFDNPLLYQYTNEEGKPTLDSILTELRNHSIEVNKKWSKKLDINQSAAVTTVKPSGTVSQLCDTASGIHPRFSQYYLRSVRADVKDPLAHFMINKGFPYEQDVHNNDNYVFYFPIKSPDGAVTADDVGAIDQLSLWEIYQDSWTEHKPSMTCYYNENEFLDVGNWVWNNFNKISGISFLPRADHVYKQAPYQKISKEEYERWVERMPQDVDWTELTNYETGDHTEGSQELSCSAGSCDIT